MLAIAQAKPKITPVANVEFFAAKTRFDGDDSSLTGNGNWTVAAAVQLSDKLSLLPSYSGFLRRTVQIQDLVGGGVLTQSEQAHIVNFKAIKRLQNPAWKLKGKVGYKKDLLRESSDEGWGDGLFDYDKYVVGFEVEKEGQRIRSLQTGLDYFMLHYPNFQSLSSSQFGSEIQAGTDVLDLSAIDWLTTMDIQLRQKSFLSVSALVSPRFYKDAKIINDTGAFDSDKREDLYLWNGYNFRQTFRPLRPDTLNMENSAGTSFSWALNDSNQNNFDAANTQFNKNYYSYFEWEVSPSWGARFYRKWRSNIGYAFAQRSYSDRPVQSITGAYTSSKVTTETQTYSGQLAYQFHKNFSVNGNIAYQIAKSNQKYEQTYKYNYEATNFMVGIAFSY